MSTPAKAPQLKQTKEYRLFKFDPSNRSVRKVKKLIVSMKQWGFLPSHPIMVYPAGSYMMVRDGQHRLEAARQLGLPIFYVCLSALKDVDISELNGAGAGPWTPVDHVESKHNQGKLEYTKLRAFINEHKMPVNVCAGLLYGRGADGSLTDIVRSGKFSVREPHIANAVAQVVHKAREVNRKCVNRAFIAAVHRAIRVTGVTATLLCEKLEAAPELLRHMGTVDGYLEVLESIVNFRSRSRMPLKFLANEAAANRNPTKRN